jgi:hydroxyacylglutathione hydrolase
MILEQIEDKGLAHYGYILLSEKDRSAVAIDPPRDLQPVVAFLERHKATLIAVIETHPHADFVSGHLELHSRFGATILTSERTKGLYPHQAFDDGDSLRLADFDLQALNTPGHSPDSISVLMVLEGKPYALFTGDFLFLGDVGRPDLREAAGAETAARSALASQMYHSLTAILGPLPDSVLVYPAHGAGSLCGKALSSAHSGTIGQERLTNWALQPQSESAFVEALTKDQPFVPKYFGQAVETNRMGAIYFETALAGINQLASIPAEVLVLDTRDGQAFHSGHVRGAINLQVGGKFETWLGAIVRPGEAFVLLVDSPETGIALAKRVVAIGYEKQMAGYLLAGDVEGKVTENGMDRVHFNAHPEAYTIIDVRNYGEVAQRVVFEGSLHIPLPELRERIAEIPTDKPVVVHCAAGYRSAAASSILQDALQTVMTYDLGEAIKGY